MNHELEKLEYVRVKLLAYTLWQKRGCPIGSPDDDWFQAEKILGVPRSDTELPLFAFALEPSTG
jgi:Protein of unknown function (DUF2934)